jgi:glycosyltransferase involved in cell wall biosynthesis
MKVLLLTTSQSLYKKSGNFYNGVSWMFTFEQYLTQINEVDIYVACWDKETKKIENNNRIYYLMKRPNSLIQKSKKFFFCESQEDLEMDIIAKTVKECHPDIIHVFGSENNFGLITLHSQIPTVIHIQGILNPYVNAWFPPNFNFFDLFLHDYNLKRIYNRWWAYAYNIYMAKRELTIHKFCKYYMGRSIWDERVTKILSPDSLYLHSGEILRTEFYNSNNWKPQNKSIIKIITTISSSLYKGYDLVLKTAQLLKNSLCFEFEWYVYGIEQHKFIENKLKIKSNNVNIYLKGIANAEMLCNEILDSDVYVHPSYIDNSPNSVCEAQILGIPIICTNVGGVSSLIDNNNNGILIPANDPYSLAFEIIRVTADKSLSLKLGENGRKCALIRHNPQVIIEEIVENYKTIINLHKNE